MESLNFRTTGLSREFSCGCTKRLLNDLLYGKLDVRQHEQVKRHLLYCEPCADAFGNTLAEAIYGDEAIADFLGQGNGRKMQFEVVKPPTVTQEGELQFVLRASILWEVTI